jgi:uncharacterized protein
MQTVISDFGAKLQKTFPVNPVFSGNSFVPHELDPERARLNKMFRGVPWDRVSFQMTLEIKDDYVALSDFGFCYYLPALIMSCLEDYIGQDTLPSNLVWFFHREIQKDPSNKMQSILRNLSIEQRQLIAEFFDLMAVQFAEYWFDYQLIEIAEVSDWLRKIMRANSDQLSFEAILHRYLDEDLPEFTGFDKLDINQLGIFGNSPLHVACVRGLIEEVDLLLRGGANVHMRGENGNTPLHEAVIQGHVDVVRLLLSFGAQMETKNDDGHSAIDVAVIGKKSDILTLLRA